MATKTIQVITSDLSGEELEPGQGESVLFSVGGADYKVDLTDKEAKDFYASLDKYINVATKVTGRGGRTGTRKASGSGRSADELAEIREWLTANGHEVSSRGRIKSELLDAYDAAH